MMILFITTWTIISLSKCRNTSFCQNIIKEYKKSELYPFKLSKPDHSGRFESIIAAMNLLNEEDKKQHNAEIVKQEDQGLTSYIFNSWIRKVDDKIEKTGQLIDSRFHKLD